MSLPTLKTPTFNIQLPSINKRVKFRPYTVGEEKNILMALQSADNQVIMDKTVEVCQVCVEDDIDIRDLAVFDLEKLVIAIRCKSVGEEVKTGVKCKQCNTSTEVSVNLENIKRKNPEDPQYKIMINDEYGLQLRFPSLKTMGEGVTPENELIDIIKSSIESVFNSENVFPFDDETEEEKDKFVESLGVDVVKKINDQFLERIPRNYIDIKFKCPNCGESVSMEVENVLDFFI